jgi:hypothetical protein
MIIDHLLTHPSPHLVRVPQIIVSARLPPLHISILLTDGPGLSPKNPMAIDQMPIAQVDSPIPKGRYLIKNRAANIYWYKEPIMLYFWFITTMSIWRGGATGFLPGQVNKHSLISQLFRRITLFRSGTSHMTLMVTSS